MSTKKSPSALGSRGGELAEPAVAASQLSQRMLSNLNSSSACIFTSSVGRAKTETPSSALQRSLSDVSTVASPSEASTLASRCEACPDLAATKRELQADMTVKPKKKTFFMIWNIDGGEVKQVFVGHTAELLYCAFSPDGLCVATLSADHT